MYLRMRICTFRCLPGFPHRDKPVSNAIPKLCFKFTRS